MKNLRSCALLFILTACSFTGCNRRDDIFKLKSIQAKFDEEQFTEVIEECRKYLHRYPNSYQGWTLLGWAYSRIDSMETALQYFDKALAINPKAANAYVGKGAVYRITGDLVEARKNYATSIEIEPDNPEAYSSLVGIEIAEGNYSQAVEYGEKAWNMAKESPIVASNLSLAYHYNGDYKQRDRFFDHAKRLGYRNLATLEELFLEKAGQP